MKYLNPTTRAEIVSACHRGDIAIIVDVVRTDYGLAIKGYGDDDGTLLHEAAKAGQLEFVNYLLSSGADERATNGRGEMALHVAAKYGKTDIVDAIAFKRGLDLVNEPCENDAEQTALHLACSEQHIETMEKMLDELDADPLAGAKLFDRQKVTAIHQAVHEERLLSLFYLGTWQDGKLLKVEDGDGNTPLFLAVKLNRLEVLKVLISQCDDDVEAIDKKSGRTVLQEAIVHNYADVIKLLVDELEANVNGKGSKGRTALHVAIEIDSLEMTKVLLELGANVNSKDDDGNTPLHTAARFRNKGCADILLKIGKASMETVNNKGRTALALVAAEHGDKSVTKFLIQSCIKPEIVVAIKSGREDFDGAPPLHLACVHKNFECAKVLLAHCQKSSINLIFRAENGLGETVLHYCVRRRLTAVKFLLKKRAPVNEPSSTTGRTPLHLVAISDDAEMCRILLANGANPSCCSGTADASFTAPMLAAQHGSREVFRVIFEWEMKKIRKNADSNNCRADKLHSQVLSSMLQESIKLADNTEVIKFLSEQQQSSSSKHVANAAGFLGRTPIHAASLANRAETVKQFIAAGADFEVKSLARDFSRTPLHFAAMSGADETVDVLVKAGADVNRKDANGNTALHLAALAGKLSTVEKLLQLGADVVERGSENRTALHHASSWIGEDRPDEELEPIGEFLAKKLPALAMRQPKSDENALAEGGKTVMFSVEKAYDEKLAIVKRLTDHTPALGSVQDSEGNRPVHVAAKTGHIAIVKFFIDWNAAVFKEARGRMGRTPLHLSVMAWQFSTARFLIDEASASLNTRTSPEDGERTLLHLLLSEGVVSTKVLTAFKMLLQYRQQLNVDAVDSEGETPLHYAVEACDRDVNWLDVVGLLIDSGANVKLRGKLGDTPIERALRSKRDNSKIIDFMLQNGVELQRQDEISRALQIARDAGNVNIEDYLKKHQTLLIKR